MNGWRLLYVSVPYEVDEDPDTGEQQYCVDSIYLMPSGEFEIGTMVSEYGGYMPYKQLPTFEEALANCHE